VGRNRAENLTAQGNILAGERVVNNMVKNFEETKGRCRSGSSRRSKGPAGGGDTRGQIGALLVVKKGCGVWAAHDTVRAWQVDDNPEPIKELRRLVERSIPRRASRFQAARGLTARRSKRQKAKVEGKGRRCLVLALAFSFYLLP